MTYFILYNPLAGGGMCARSCERLRELLAPDVCVSYDMTCIESYAAFFPILPADAPVVLCGGDGTLNRFLNDTAELAIPNPIYYYAAGSGNDFLKDLGREVGTHPVRIDEYLRALPTAYVNGRAYRFLNGVGYGIDGYCCEVGDAQRRRSAKPVNYAAIAVRGLLFHYQPTGAAVTVDGVTHRYDHVWLAPTMNGRFYGGGMMPAPAQDRSASEGTVSVMVYHCRSKLKTLRVFPTIFRGEHVRHADMVEVLRGSEIEVAFDRPAPLQIDGETIRAVRGYRVSAARGEENASA